MKITMVMVASADGKTTKGNNANVYTWTSKEDQKHFFSLIKKNHLIVMGSSTYEAARPNIKLEKNKLRIVLTRHPKKYLSQSVPGRLEFSAESPARLVRRLSKSRHKKMLLTGGSIINGLFLKQNLVDEFYLTIEPKMFGSGKNIAEGQLFNRSLKLISAKKLNKKGTLLLKYSLVHPKGV